MAYQLAEKILQPNTLDQARFAKSQLHQQDTNGQQKKWGELSLNIRNDSFGKEGEVKKTIMVTLKRLAHPAETVAQVVTTELKTHS